MTDSLLEIVAGRIACGESFEDLVKAAQEKGHNAITELSEDQLQALRQKAEPLAKQLRVRFKLRENRV